LNLTTHTGAYEGGKKLTNKRKERVGPQNKPRHLTNKQKQLGYIKGKRLPPTPSEPTKEGRTCCEKAKAQSVNKKPHRAKKEQRRPTIWPKHTKRLVSRHNIGNQGSLWGGVHHPGRKTETGIVLGRTIQGKEREKTFKKQKKGMAIAITAGRENQMELGKDFRHGGSGQIIGRKRGEKLPKTPERVT